MGCSRKTNKSSKCSKIAYAAMQSRIKGQECVLNEIVVILERAGIKLENKGDLSFFYDELANSVSLHSSL